MSNLPVMCVFGAKDISLRSADCPNYETRDMDVRYYPEPNDRRLYEILAEDRPVIIVTFGDRTCYPKITGAPDFVKRMHIHFENTRDLEEKGIQAFNVFIGNVVGKRGRPLVSVFTPAYRTGDKIEKPLRSLLSQGYSDWEWVIVDDSDDNGETFSMLSKVAERDGRIRVYRERRPSGRIGNVKRTACGICRGDYLVELDHDDELTADALGMVAQAFEDHPDAGFVYTDFAECSEDGEPRVYPAGWGMGYGSYRQETHGGVKYMVANGPNINPKTIRHIIAAPNHIRSWRRSFYDQIGGHCDLLHVADDYELMVRTFLKTRMVRVPRMCYIQYLNMDGTGNTHRVRNAEIQRLVRYLSMAMDKDIHERFVELGIDDFVWREGSTSFDRLLGIPNPSQEQHCTILHEIR